VGRPFCLLFFFKSILSFHSRARTFLQVLSVLDLFFNIPFICCGTLSPVALAPTQTETSLPLAFPPTHHHGIPTTGPCSDLRSEKTFPSPKLISRVRLVFLGLVLCASKLPGATHITELEQFGRENGWEDGGGKSTRRQGRHTAPTYPPILSYALPFVAWWFFPALDSVCISYSTFPQATRACVQTCEPQIGIGKRDNQ
jgi:hypothetical protein